MIVMSNLEVDWVLWEVLEAVWLQSFPNHVKAVECMVYASPTHMGGKFSFCLFKCQQVVNIDRKLGRDSLT